MSIRTLATAVTLGILAAWAATPCSAAVVPCVNGFAGPYPCKGVDLMAFLPHSTWNGGGGNDMWGWADPQTGHEYAIVGTRNGTAFVDVTVADAPVYVGVLPAPTASIPRHGDGDADRHCPPGEHLGLHDGSCSGSSLWRDMEVFGDHVYIGSEQAGHGLVVFDMSQLRNVTNPPVTFAETFRFTGIGNSHTITVNPQSGIVFANGSRSATACATILCPNGLPCPTNTGGPVMLDASVNPSAPVLVGCNVVDGYTHDSQCVTYAGPDAAYTGHEICLNSNEDTLTIVDVTNKLAPVMVSRTAYAGRGYTHQGWLTEDHRYFLLDDELDEDNFGHNTKTYIFDMLSLGSPQLIGTHIAGTRAIDHNQYIAGRYSYQSNYRAGLRILHTGRARLGRLKEVAYFDVFPADDNSGFAGTWGNYPFLPSGNVVVSTMESGGGLFVLRPRLANLQMEVAQIAPGVFRLTVTNDGPAAVEAADVALEGGTIWSLQPSQGSCSRRPAQCALGPLASGATAIVDVTLSPFAVSRRVRAEVMATGALDGVAADDSVSFAPTPAWK